MLILVNNFIHGDGCSCVVVNGDVVAQGSQFSLKDVEVVVAQIDLDALEVQYLHDYTEISTTIGLTVNPIINFSGVVGTNVVALGTDVSFDSKTGLHQMQCWIELHQLRPYRVLHPDPVIGDSLLLTYTTGYVAPLLLAASFAGALQSLLLFRKFSAWINPMSGALLLGGGIYTLLDRLFPVTMA
ncbi:hypothetical protein LOK49_LG09G01037 [Camellia lanceoleosa]|uniref:Uncharacterized protein n=1 Tax=Camellia lanceoleosa TaxID=1840588 RepID=A0ACC0GJ97_9ERIC|nr:hypothetical protein LOK49_LG09G01037 [Camellia lanceoleosa]